jgi:hypothetical protein
MWSFAGGRKTPARPTSTDSLTEPCLTPPLFAFAAVAITVALTEIRYSRDMAIMAVKIWCAQ